MTYLDILQDKEIMAILNQIDILKQADAKYYGIIHTLSTIDYAKQLSICFELNAHERELLYIACALHNIGHLNGKTLHDHTGAEMARTYLRKHDFDVKEINCICSAIKSHTGKTTDNFYDGVSACLILADKMDFGASRIKPHFPYLSEEEEICKAITNVWVDRKDDTVVLWLQGSKVDWNAFVQTSIYSKLYRCFSTVCKKNKLKFVVRVKKGA